MPEAKKFPQYAYGFIAASVAFSTGIAFGWTSPVVDEITSGAYGFNVTLGEYSWIGASLPLGAIISCIPSGFLIDMLGRQLALVLVVIPSSLGWILIRVAKNVWYLYIGRAVLGMVCGALYIAIPVYIAEIAEKERRGVLGMFFQLLSYGGILFAYILGAFTDIFTFTFVCLVVPLFITSATMFIPESPAFLIQKGRDKEAKIMIEMLRGSKYDMTDELTEMKEDFSSWRSEQKSLFASMKSRACLKALYISCGLMCFQQLCGMCPILFYTTEIFQMSKSNLEPRFATIIVGSVQFLAKLAITFFADRIGRRILLLVSAGFVTLIHFSLASYFVLLEKNMKVVEMISWLPPVAICIFAISFSFGFGSVPWIIIGEVFPPDVKGAASSFAITIFWSLGFFMAKIYVDIKLTIGIDAAFWFFGACTLLSFIFVYFFVPETKGKGLTEILQELSGSGKTN